jgi:hypothetical protein
LPGEEYKRIVYAITPSGQKRKVQSDEEEFHTEAVGSDARPVVNIQNAPKSRSPDAIMLDFYSDRKIQMEIYCNKRVDGLANPVPCPQKKYGEIRLTDAGRHLGGVKTYEGQSEILIPGLEPDSVYEFSGKAVSENGIETNLVFLSTYKTLTAPSKVDFSGPVNFEIRPDITLVSWRWTSEPREANVILKTGERTVQFEPPKVDTNTSSITAAVPLAKVMGRLALTTRRSP